MAITGGTSKNLNQSAIVAFVIAIVAFAARGMWLAAWWLVLISIPMTNTSVSPARSTATALFVGGWAVQQLWLFWLAPVVGAAIAGFVHTSLLESPAEEPPVTGRVASRVPA
jgi:aquaporin Z